MQWYAMAMEVILTTLGPDWWKKNCTSNAVKPDEFLAVPDDSAQSAYNHQDRIIKLGHMLYALRDCNGFDSFISALVTRDVAPAFFELWVANALRQNEYTIEFVDPLGEKGTDYDLRCDRNTIRLNIEAKSRRAGMLVSENSLRNALKKARTQLPASGPNVIFISIPAEWTTQANAESKITSCIQTFFHNSARVNYVVLMWHGWLQLAERMASLTFIRQYDNPNARAPVALETVIKPVTLPLDVTSEK